MNYTESLEYIRSVGWLGSRPGLGRITELCRLLGDPQKKLKFIHVAGTNGKGSFCAMTASVLRAAGYRVGLYVSPCITRFNDRMSVNGEPIGDELLAELVTLVREKSESMDEPATEFELITAAAFEYFRRESCDVVVLEVGMGGRMDATNIIEEPVLSVITGIALDHTAFLGDTVEKVAFEKAGIIKEGVPVLFGGNDKAAERVIAARADEKKSEFIVTDRSAISEVKATLDGTVFDFGERKGLRVSLLGLYQTLNAANVLTAVDILKKNGMDIPEDAVYHGLSEAKWSARFERIGKDPTVIYDGAHNPEGISAAVSSIKEYFPKQKVYALSGVMKDKDYDCIAADLSTVASRVFAVTPDNPRALDATEYAKTLSLHGIDAKPFGTLKEALETAVAAAKADGVPLFCLGSLYMYSELMDIFEKM